MRAANPARWRWVETSVAFAIHDVQIAEHGGSDGVRDANAIESALMRPVNLSLYAEPEAADLAASYAYGLAKNHRFVDGNKRTAWVVARVFLAENGHGLTFEVDEAVQVMEQVSASEISETELAHWLRERLVADQGLE